MRLDDIEESSNVEDRRGAPAGKLAIGGGLGTIVIVILYTLLGGNPNDLKGALPSTGSQSQLGGTTSSGPGDDAGKKFVSKVLKETEEVWSKILPEQTGKQYVDPKLVLFSDRVQSACGLADAAVGPFYCPGDSQVYIDLSFYDTLKNQLGAGGDFAQAYVIAHEVGHHVQNLLGTSHQVDAARARLSGKDFNKVSVRMELQADFLAGVWAHYATDLHIDKQDIQEAVNAASQIGDDKLQKESQGYVVPDSFTHGTSAQRVRWFLKGYQTGRIADGDTFNARQL
ncbi:MAG: zinc metallopeptidase [Armatimonadetes bacterium]|nr:zinc metallopeptidase [Armatimonadota bacterium]MBS1725706.1 zinc metallopeptidase [Armatimonadota bacterium]